MNGLIIDNFAGGGGASTGIAWAIGRSVDIAINHDPDAIAMHKANHPETLHYCESVFDIDPLQATAGKPVDLAWFSPDCKHFSKAKGSKPVNKEIRGLAWVAIRWAMKVRPKIIMLENVEEFKTWGPVIECLATESMRPCPDRKGETFDAFVKMLSDGIDADHPALTECVDTLGLLDTAKLIKGLGYKVEWREMRACDFGSPTIRKRFFMIARCDNQPIVWPQPTHGAPDSEEVKSGRLKPWRTAAECIDWSIPCKSIFGRKRPLAENTMKRIAKGIQKFVIDSANPFIAPAQVTITPFVTECANASAQRNMPANEPLRTICAEIKGGHFALVTSHMVKMRGTNIGFEMTEPAHTITAGGLHLGEVRAFFIKYYGNEQDGVACNEPLHTITTNDRFGLVTIKGESYQIVDIGLRMLEPHELFACQGFSSDYIISDYNGKSTKKQQVARVGNSVPPQLSEALVKANLPGQSKQIAKAA
ncbi:type II DNA modification methyltransferase [Shewanella algicola]|uniref:DNA (cytosine-5-)-methyltransferase n=1 Tax=Shewanella algicola TaxID=640633 RepID=A0A9X1Z2G2_9GAMM|nr:DNA cytosine methyltransferase [Shewanella algicola]MCL1103695.1 DNA cytosine methyltransferase [Shewanella algicola]GGP37656.1 type II DNA modification methyltransferase [Shewanella algicola]